MKFAALIIGLSICLSVPPVAGQDEGEADRDTRFAELTASAAPNIPESGLIMLDVQCHDEDAESVEGRLINWLKSEGYKVEERAPMTLRVEITPCEDIGLLPGRGSVADAYNETSKADEFSRAKPSVRIPFGKNRRNDYRVNIRMLLFQSGQKPLWSAHIVGTSSALKQRETKLELLSAALGAFGETAERKIPLEKK